jgi:hypothetical protein
MRAGGSKQKGASNERKLCVVLSLWLSKGTRKDLLWRSAMSGGRSTIAMRQGTVLGSQVGDISSIDKLSHHFISRFLIEAKHIKNLEIASLIKGTGLLASFWRRAKADAVAHKKLPIIMARQNNWPMIVCLDAAGLQELKINGNVRLTAPELDLHIILLDDFLKLDPQSVHRPARLRLDNSFIH